MRRRRDRFEDRALLHLDASEARMVELDRLAAAEPGNLQVHVDRLLEGARNDALREVLGKDSRRDELAALASPEG